MDSKRLIQKIVSFVLAWLIIFNYCDLSFLNAIINLKNAEAAETLNPSALWAEKMNSLGWIDENNEPQANMWADTTVINTAWINTEIAGVGNASTATSIGLPISDVAVSESAVAVSNYAYDPDMATEDIPTLYYTLEYDEVLNGYYRIYYVSTANQLMQLLSMSKTSFNNIRPNENEIKTYVEDYKTIKYATKLGIKLLCDIDLGGSNDKYWIGTSNSSVYLDIDGNGNKIYNGYFSRIENGVNATTGATIYINYTFLNNSAQHFYIHDVDFDNMFIARPGGIFGTSISYSYFDNVNFEHCLGINTAESGVAIVLGYSYLRDYFNNCMIRNSYVCGRGHCATFASYNGGTGFDSTVSYIGDTDSTATSFYYTDIPPSIEEVEKVWKGYDTVYEGKTYTLNNAKFPSIYKNSMAIDCEVYELALNHSGTFVSCLQSHMIFKNCFTNSTIYATTQSGVFTGCVIGCGDGFYYNVEGEKTLVNSYFENCYTSGLIEGKTSVGGFIGGIFNDNRAYGYDTNKNVAYTQYRGKVVCKNCYSTSSVGMQYSGNYVGGFVGQIYGNVRSEGTDSDKQHLFINCYAAGEVGGITTDTSTDSTNTNSIGGFFGSYLKTDPNTITTSNGITFDNNALMPFVCMNCCYDKQTTAMRERDIGNYNARTSLNGSVDTITGLYTLTSTQKNVKGLADTDGIMGSDDVWLYKSGYYPQLNVFTSNNENNFGSKAETARLYSQASTATVFLDHWDTIMNGAGDTVPTADTTIYDTVRDISSKFEFTSGGNSAVSNLGWQTNTEKNAQSGFTPYLGGTDENSNPVGFDVSFDISQTSNKTETVTKNYAPSVLTISADMAANDDYTFKCFDFAAGKQFVKVTTCSEANYKKWFDKQTDYDSYIADLNEMNAVRSNYIDLLGLDTSKTDDEIREALKAKILALTNFANDSTEESIAESLKDILYKGSQYFNGSLDEDEKVEYRAELIATIKGLDESSSDEYIYEKYKALSAYSYYPFRPLEAVEKPTDFRACAEAETGPSDTSESEFGSRTLRLIPTAYLNAGDMININVFNDINNDGALTNNVTTVVNSTEYTMSRFDHTIGVVYASTQGLPAKNENNTVLINTCLGERTCYDPQTVNFRDNYFDTDSNSFVKSSLDNDKVFALYDYYPTYKTEEKTDGLDGLTNQISLGNFFSTNAEDYGKTMVVVYKGIIENIDGNSKNFVLKKADTPVNMSENNNLEKWSGTALFDDTDKGYYYMVYYWRMSDGRYLEENKLVNITTDSYTMEMRTGVANATEDSFSGEKNDSYTYIDCDVAENVNLDSGDLSDYEFPSDYFVKNLLGNTSWEDYTAQKYESYDKIINYPDNSEGVPYWSKSVKTTTMAGTVTVAWRKSPDYSLEKLIVEVHKTDDAEGVWHPMTYVNLDNDDITIDNTDDLQYSYTYSSYKVTQDTETKQFTVVETSNTVRRFSVEDFSGDVPNTAVKSIKFNFLDSAEGQSSVKLTDDIRVTALFRTVAADVEAEKYVVIDDGKIEQELVSSGGNILPLYQADAYRSVDNQKFSNDLQRAVLFGDKLIYRMRLQNVGVYDASNVVVTDTIPEGCSLIDGTVKVYRQKKNVNKNEGTDVYEQLELIGGSASIDSDSMNGNYAEEKYYYYVDTDNNKITWLLNPVRMDYDYYAEFEVTVDDIYTKFSQSEAELKNQAKFTYSYINGDVISDSAEDSTQTEYYEQHGQYNEKYASKAVFNVTSDIADTFDGKIGYTLNFETQNTDSSQYSITSITSQIPAGYTFVTDDSGKIDVGIESANYTIDDFSITASGNIFTVKPADDKTVTFGKGNSIKLVFQVEAPSGGTEDRHVNQFSINYYKIDSSGAALQNSITKVDDVTNQVESSARWLYLNVEKEIRDEDNAQAFLFKAINNNDTAQTLFADIFANNKDGENDTYRGNQLIQIIQRGNYTVSETDWANTDYDIDSAFYSSTDIDISDLTIKQGEITAASHSVSLYIPRAMYESTAFPIWAAEDEDGNNVYPTVTCVNTPSEYAWLSAQSNVENSFSISSIAQTQLNMLSAAASRSAAASNTDEAVSSQAVIPPPVTLKKDEDEQ